VHVATPLGRALRDLAPAFASQHAGRAFLGTMTQQRERLVGNRGQKANKRPELEAAYGCGTNEGGCHRRLMRDALSSCIIVPVGLAGRQPPGTGARLRRC